MQRSQVLTANALLHRPLPRLFKLEKKREKYKYIRVYVYIAHFYNWG